MDDLQEQEKKGRPKIRWEEEIIRTEGIAWGRVDMVQTQWGWTSEAYTQKWACDD